MEVVERVADLRGGVCVLSEGAGDKITDLDSIVRARDGAVGLCADPLRLSRRMILLFRSC